MRKRNRDQQNVLAKQMRQQLRKRLKRPHTLEEREEMLPRYIKELEMLGMRLKKEKEGRNAG